MSTTILDGSSNHLTFACWLSTNGPAAGKRRQAAPRPRPLRCEQQRRHGCLPKRLGSQWSFRPPKSEQTLLRNRVWKSRSWWQYDASPTTQPQIMDTKGAIARRMCALLASAVCTRCPSITTELRGPRAADFTLPPPCAPRASCAFSGEGALRHVSVNGRSKTCFVL